MWGWYLTCMEIETLLTELGYTLNAQGDYIYSDGYYLTTVDMTRLWVTKTRVLNGSHVFETNFSTLRSFVQAIGTTMSQE